MQYGHNKLDPILQDGTLRVGGRLNKSAMPENVKHPAVLSKHCKVATLILRGIHQRTGVTFIKLRGIVTKSIRTPKSQDLRAPKNIQTYKTLRTHTSKQSLLYKSQSAYKCAQLNQLHAPPCTRPFLTINCQCKLPDECDLHIKQTQMQVLCLVGNNGRRTEKSKKAKFREG